jgi:hypothetical protein
VWEVVEGSLLIKGSYNWNGKEGRWDRVHCRWDMGLKGGVLRADMNPLRELLQLFLTLAWVLWDLYG